MTFDYRPRLRDGLRRDEAAVALFDPPSGLRLPLDPLLSSLLPLVDGATAAPEILRRLAGAQAGAAGSDLGHALRRLLLLHFVAGAGDAIRDQVIAARGDHGDAPTRLIDGARFGCQGSGACCRDYIFGPLDDDDVDRLLALDSARLPPPLDTQPFLDLREWTADTRTLHLVTVAGRCVFLLPDRRCALHATFGAAAKPRFCRLFPLQALRTIDGLRIYDRGECESFPVSARGGLPIADDLARLRALIGRPPLHHPPWRLDQDTLCDYGHLLALQGRLDQLARGAATTATAIAECARLTVGFVAALRGCPIAPGEPDRTVARALAQPCPAASSTRLAEPQSRAALAAVASRLGDVFAAAAAESGPHAAPASELRALLAELPIRDPASSRPPLPSAVDRTLRLSLRHQLFGAQLLCGGSPVAGLLRIALVHCLAVVAARGEAAREGAPVEPRHLGHGHALAHRLLRQAAPVAVFVAQQQLAPQVATALALLGG